MLTARAAYRIRFSWATISSSVGLEVSRLSPVLTCGFSEKVDQLFSCGGEQAAGRRSSKCQMRDCCISYALSVTPALERSVLVNTSV